MDEDFIDLPSPSPVEEDPWDAVAKAKVRERPAYTKTGDGLPSSVSASDGIQRHTQLTLGVDDLVEDSESEDTQLIPPDDEVGNSTLDVDIPDEWFKDDAESDIDLDLSDDPIPIAEFDPDLSEELYGPVEEINLTDVEIRLDQFLARLSLSNDQTIVVRTHLESFSRARLSNWLPWLNSKVWTSDMFTDFVRFHSHWEAMPEWWESRWHSLRYGWRVSTSPMSNILSRDDAYEIVRCRIGNLAQDVVDDLWFGEWDYYSMWRHGFWSFAKFARFRAALNPGEDWRSLVEWTDLDDDLEQTTIPSWDTEITRQSIDGKIPLWENDLCTYSYVSALPGWYVIQDWYQEDEWHDNLGWAVQEVGVSVPSGVEKRLVGSFWPIGGRNV